MSSIKKIHQGGGNLFLKMNLLNYLLWFWLLCWRDGLLRPGLVVTVGSPPEVSRPVPITVFRRLSFAASIFFALAAFSIFDDVSVDDDATRGGGADASGLSSVV